MCQVLSPDITPQLSELVAWCVSPVWWYSICDPTSIDQSSRPVVGSSFG